MKKIFYIIISIVFISISCDKVDPPYIESHNGGGGDDSTIVVQKVLIEDYTAHFCVNCPRAARQLEDLVDAYGDKIVPLAIHVGFLAQPSSSPYDLDLRTPIGDALDVEFGCSASGLPVGMINRTVYNSSVLIGDGEWPSATAIILDKDPTIGLKLATEIDTVNKKLGIDINITALQDFNADDKYLKVCAYITESHLIGAQKDQDAPNGEVIDYEFNHVLRSSFNGTWGEKLADGDIIANNTITKSYSNFDIDSEWDFHNLGAVVFVYDSLSNEILQAESAEFEIE